MVGENSLSGGERSIRIFSLAAASSSASPLPPLSAGEPLIKKRNRGLKQQVCRLKGRRNLQVNWKAISVFFIYLWEKSRLDKVSRDFAHRGQALKSRRVEETLAPGEGLQLGQWQTVAGIIGQNSLTQWTVLFYSWLQKQNSQVLMVKPIQSIFFYVLF